MSWDKVIHDRLNAGVDDILRREETRADQEIDSIGKRADKALNQRLSKIDALYSRGEELEQRLSKAIHEAEKLPENWLILFARGLLQATSDETQGKDQGPLFIAMWKQILRRIGKVSDPVIQGIRHVG